MLCYSFHFGDRFPEVRSLGQRVYVYSKFTLCGNNNLHKHIQFMRVSDTL